MRSFFSRGLAGLGEGVGGADGAAASPRRRSFVPIAIEGGRNSASHGPPSEGGSLALGPWRT